jgi:predicted DNA-binding transcriptional regulator AlpA
MDQVHVVRHKVKALSAREVARPFGISRTTGMRAVAWP